MFSERFVKNKDSCEDLPSTKPIQVNFEDGHWNFLKNQFAIVQYNQIEDNNSRFKIFYLGNHRNSKNKENESGNFVPPIFDSIEHDLDFCHNF